MIHSDSFQAQSLSSISLNKGWHFKPLDAVLPKKEELGAGIGTEGYNLDLPNTVLNALNELGVIPDPFFRDNEARLQWLERKEWLFSKTFDLEKDVLGREKIELILRGCDTYAQVRLNDVVIGNLDNAFRTWRFDVKNALKERGNVLIIKFLSTIEVDKKKSDNAKVDFPDVYNTQRMFSRKPQFHYGWDWGPRFVTVGLQDITLETWQTTRIDNFFLEQINKKDNPSDSTQQDFILHSTIFATQTTPATLTLRLNGKAFEQKITLQAGANSVDFDAHILNPKLWWTHNLGTPYLYEAQLTLESVAADTAFFDEKKQRIGIRTIELVQERDTEGASFFFRLNGVPVFAKGVNYIPQHFFQEKIKKENHRQTLESARAANMNMVRVWGGGVYESDHFYDLCDEMGLLVWQDFMYACAMYPDDSIFLQNAENEAVEQVIRLRPHPCIALWCGNNEINEAWHNWGWQPRFNPDQKEVIWGAYQQLFMDILPSTVKKYAPQTAYHESSPRYGRYDKRSYTEGDNHDWFVWHDERPFEHFEEKVPRFMSEYGFQSFPEWSTIQSFTEKEDRVLESKVMLLHQKHPKGNALMRKYMAWTHRVPTSFEDFTYVSQLVQADGISRAIEAHRRAMPRCMGSLYWQLNDVWQVASWSSLDYFGRWKALHYAVRTAFSNVLVSPKFDKERLKIWLVSDSLALIEGVLHLDVLSLNGQNIYSESKKCTIKPNASDFYWDLNWRDILNKNDPRSVFFKVSFQKTDGTLLSRVAYAVPPKDLFLQRTPIFKDIKPVEGGFELTFRSASLQKNVFLSLQNGDIEANNPVFFSDNYFDLLPNSPKTVFIKTNKSAESILSALVVKSLVEVN